MENNINSITVLGSANIDYFLKVEKPPVVGETISASDLKIAIGGKGSNTAIACGKLGFPTNFIGQVGSDDNGKKVKSILNDCNVNSDNLNILENNVTGQAYIMSYPDGNNSIIIVGGANTNWDMSNLSFIDNSLKNCKF